MHKELIEMIEMTERERIVREEAWRQQEMERKGKNRQRGSLEAAGDGKDEKRRRGTIPGDVLQPSSHFLHSKLSTIPCMEGNGAKPIQERIKIDSNNNRRWPEAEVQALIMLRMAFEQSFHTFGSRGCYIWDEISAGMFNMGYNRTAKKCKEEWENMNKYFKKSKGRSD